MKRFILHLLMFTVLLGLCGCPPKEIPKAKLTLRGPEGMSVSFNGEAQAAGALEFELIPGRYLCRFEAPGYERRWQLLTLTPNEQRELEVEMNPLVSCVLVESDPPGASLVLDGRAIGATPLVLEEVASGEYHAQLQMPGYSETGISWKIDGARPVRVTAKLDSNMATLDLTSVPENAQVFIDGRAVGVTPYKGEQPSGKCILRLEYPGYAPMEEAITMGIGETVKRDFALTSLPGGIEVISYPDGAELFVNDRKYGVTPAQVSGLIPGIYNIRAEKEGYDPMLKQIEITAGYQDKIEFELLSSTGAVVLNVKPAGVYVKLDNRDIGRSTAGAGEGLTEPITIDKLAPGEHVVTISHPRANPSSRSIKLLVTKGGTLQRSLELWIPTCEIKYNDGTVEQGVLVKKDENSILFSPATGVRYQIMLSDISDIKMLPIE